LLFNINFYKTSLGSGELYNVLRTSYIFRRYIKMTTSARFF